MSVLFKETNRQSKMKKEPQPTPANGHRLRLFAFGKNSTFIPAIWLLRAQTRKYTRHPISAAYRAKNRDFQPLSRHIFCPICPLGCVEGTRYNFSPEALLARMNAAAAQVIVFAPSVAT
jgi:hypothetical protein